MGSNLGGDGLDGTVVVEEPGGVDRLAAPAISETPPVTSRHPRKRHGTESKSATA